jgi:hypothetical protein
MSIGARELSLDQVVKAMGYAYHVVQDSLEAGFKPVFGSGGLNTHFIGKLGEIIAMKDFELRNIDMVSTPLRAYYGDLDRSDDFVLRVDGKDIKVEIKTADVLKPLDDLATGFRFFLNANQGMSWDWVVCVFVNTQNLTYRIMGCVERDHVDVYPIAGGRGVRHYEIPLEFLLPIECIWEDCSWKDQ